jgi:uncharacterized protein YggT (Ycf19 family)
MSGTSQSRQRLGRVLDRSTDPILSFFRKAWLANAHAG